MDSHDTQIWFWDFVFRGCATHYQILSFSSTQLILVVYWPLPERQLMQGIVRMARHISTIYLEWFFNRLCFRCWGNCSYHYLSYIKQLHRRITPPHMQRFYFEEQETLFIYREIHWSFNRNYKQILYFFHEKTPFKKSNLLLFIWPSFAFTSCRLQSIGIHAQTFLFM